MISPLILGLLISSTKVNMPANLPVPSPQQLEWQDMEMGMFVHFAPNTWDDTEGDQLHVPLSSMNPSKLDTDQWARTAKEMGAKYLVFVAKHGGGFCWWRTSTTDRSVAHIPWRDGKGDVMADVAKSCKKFGLKLGIYISPTDRSQDAEVRGELRIPPNRWPTPSFFELN